MAAFYESVLHKPSRTVHHHFLSTVVQHHHVYSDPRFLSIHLNGDIVHPTRSRLHTFLSFLCPFTLTDLALHRTIHGNLVMTVTGWKWTGPESDVQHPLQYYWSR